MPNEEVNISGISEATPNEAAAVALLDTIEELRGNVGQLLKGVRVGISISDSPELAALGFGKAHQEDASVEFARYLLANGATLLYGGDLRKDGYTELFFALANHYNVDRKLPPLVHSYLAWPLHLDLTTKRQAEFIKQVQFHPIGLPDDLDLDPMQFIRPDTVPHRYAWARALTKMREELEEKAHAHIILGGPETTYSGALPGLLEEALLSLRLDKPTYLIGAFGGAAQGIIESLRTPESRRFADLPAKLPALTQEFMTAYNEKHLDKPLDFDDIQEFLGSYSLTRLSQNNGLDIEENERLFKTSHLMEMIYLVLTGLARVTRRKQLGSESR